METSPGLDIALKSASYLTAALRARELGALELLDHQLARVERLNPRLNAVVTLDADRARAEARLADERSARGDALGPLHGLPLTIKDAIETDGMRTTCGVPLLADHVPAADAEVVARLRTAGAIVFGKTNTPAWTSDNQTFNAVFGATNNPWDLTRGPGGSSGGAAAAVAAGLTSLEVGSDIAGSLRNPAHYCGVYGHKSSWGVIPDRGHIPGPPGTLAPTDVGVLGPLARSAGDLRLAMSVLAGPDAAHGVAWRFGFPPSRHQSLDQYRVAAWLDDPAAPVDGSVLDCLHAVIDALRSTGVSVDETARPAFSLQEMDDVARTLVSGVFCSGPTDDEYAALAKATANLSTDDNGPVANYLRDTTQSKRLWNTANERRWKIRSAWADFFCSFDVLLCPPAQTAAFPHDPRPNLLARRVLVNGEERPAAEALVWARFVGAAGLPSTVAPVGATPEGLPVGVQIIGPYLEDLTTIDFASMLADGIGGYNPPPGYE